MKVTCLGAFGQKTGYGVAFMDNCMALLRAGVDINIKPILDVPEDWNPGRFAELLPFVNIPGYEETHLIVHTIPAGLEVFMKDEFLPKDDVKRIGYTTWETSVFPRPYADFIKYNYDQVWVPSHYCADAIVNAGVSDTGVRVVPHTFDPDRWYARDHHKPDTYTFYTALTWCTRKEPVGLLKAYLTEFTEKDDVLLKMKTPGYTVEETDALSRGLGLSYYPPVDMITDYWTDDQMIDLHYDSHCYVTCARSEGWGLGAFEALIVGNPVIATGYSGLLDFLSGAYNVELLPYFLTPAYTPETLSNSEFRVGNMIIKAVNRNDHYGIRGDQDWAEPDLYTLKKHMRHAYETRRGTTIANKHNVVSSYSYEAVGKRMRGYLENM